MRRDETPPARVRPLRQAAYMLGETPTLNRGSPGFSLYLSFGTEQNTSGPPKSTIVQNCISPSRLFVQRPIRDAADDMII